MLTFKLNPFTGNFDLVSGIALAAVGTSPNANGATLSADQVLNLEPADATNPGVLSTVAQDIAGEKAFLDPITVETLLRLTDDTIQTIDSAATTTGLTVATGSATNGGASTGALTLKSGNRSTNGGGSTGSVTLQSGDGTATPGGTSSGSVTVKSGNTPNGGSSGVLALSSGNSGSSPSGDVSLQSGSSDGLSGSVTIASGPCTSTASGSITLSTGTSTAPTIDRGRIILSAKSISIAAAHTADPTGAVAAGELYYNTTLGAYRYYNGTVWVTLASAASTPITEYHTITGGEETAKAFTMAQTPVDATVTLCDIISGTSQHYNIDFTISGNTFDWDGLGLDGVLSAGDVVRLHYFY